MLRRMAPLTINSTLKLRSGYDIPVLGFGVSLVPPQEPPCDKLTLSGLANVNTPLNPHPTNPHQLTPIAPPPKPKQPSPTPSTPATAT